MGHPSAPGWPFHHRGQRGRRPRPAVPAARTGPPSASGECCPAPHPPSRRAPRSAASTRSGTRELPVDSRRSARRSVHAVIRAGQQPRIPRREVISHALNVSLSSLTVRQTVPREPSFRRSPGRNVGACDSLIDKMLSMQRRSLRLSPSSAGPSLQRNIGRLIQATRLPKKSTPSGWPGKAPWHNHESRVHARAGGKAGGTGAEVAAIGARREAWRTGVA